MSLQPQDEVLPDFTPFETEPPDPFMALVAEPAAVPVPQLNGASDSGPLAPRRRFLQLYGLASNPFADCVNPGFFFRTDPHAEAFRTAMLAVEFEASLGLL